MSQSRKRGRTRKQHTSKTRKSNRRRTRTCAAQTPLSACAVSGSESRQSHLHHVAHLFNDKRLNSTDALSLKFTVLRGTCLCCPGRSFASSWNSSTSNHPWTVNTESARPDTMRTKTFVKLRAERCQSWCCLRETTPWPHMCDSQAKSRTEPRETAVPHDSASTTCKCGESTLQDSSRCPSGERGSLSDHHSADRK